MKTNTKIVITAVASVAALIADKVLTPAANLVANQTIVAQLEHSDQASLMNTLVGNGSHLAGWFIGIVYAIVLLIVWTRKNESVK